MAIDRGRVMANGETAPATDAQGQPKPAEEKAGAGKTGKKKGRILEGLKWLALAVAGFLLGDAYNAARDWAMDKPDYLEELSKSQKAEFASLRESLQGLGSTIESGDRKALAQVKSAVDSIEQTNKGLIQQLVLAKQENETLRKVAGQQAGISGGYDFILPEARGIRIDPATVLGVESVGHNGVRVNLTSQQAEKPLRQYLSTGQFVAYTNAQGSACKLSLLSFSDGRPGSAAFSNHCG